MYGNFDFNDENLNDKLSLNSLVLTGQPIYYDRSINHHQIPELYHPLCLYWHGNPKNPATAKQRVQVLEIDG